MVAEVEVDLQLSKKEVDNTKQQTYTRKGQSCCCRDHPRNRWVSEEMRSKMRVPDGPREMVSKVIPRGALSYDHLGMSGLRFCGTATGSPSPLFGTSEIGSIDVSFVDHYIYAPLSFAEAHPAGPICPQSVDPPTGINTHPRGPSWSGQVHLRSNTWLPTRLRPPLASAVRWQDRDASRD